MPTGEAVDTTRQAKLPTLVKTAWCYDAQFPRSQKLQTHTHRLRVFAPLPEFSVTLGLQAYTAIMHCPAKGKQLIKRRCCCCYLSIRIRFMFVSILNSYSIYCSFHFNSFAIHFHLFIQLFVRSIKSSTSLRYNQSNLTLYVNYCTPAVHSLPGSTVRLPHDFVFIVC